MTRKSVLGRRKSTRKHINQDAVLKELKREEMKRINLMIPKSKFDAFKKISVIKNKTMTELISSYINRYIVNNTHILKSINMYNDEDN